MTSKSLIRAFRRELRTTFGAWQRAVRVEQASRRLAVGQSVTEVALEMGYEASTHSPRCFVERRLSHRATW